MRFSQIRGHQRLAKFGRLEAPLQLLLSEGLTPANGLDRKARIMATGLTDVIEI